MPKLLTKLFSVPSFVSHVKLSVMNKRTFLNNFPSFTHILPFFTCYHSCVRKLCELFNIVLLNSLFIISSVKTRLLVMVAVLEFPSNPLIFFPLSLTISCRRKMLSQLIINYKPYQTLRVDVIYRSPSNFIEFDEHLWLLLENISDHNYYFKIMECKQLLSSIF